LSDIFSLIQAASWDGSAKIIRLRCLRREFSTRLANGFSGSRESQPSERLIMMCYFKKNCSYKHFGQGPAPNLCLFSLKTFYSHKNYDLVKVFLLHRLFSEFLRSSLAYEIAICGIRLCNVD